MNFKQIFVIAIIAMFLIVPFASAKQESVDVAKDTKQDKKIEERAVDKTKEQPKEVKNKDKEITGKITVTDSNTSAYTVTKEGNAAIKIKNDGEHTKAKVTIPKEELQKIDKDGDKLYGVLHIADDGTATHDVVTESELITGAEMTFSENIVSGYIGFSEFTQTVNSYSSVINLGYVNTSVIIINTTLPNSQMGIEVPNGYTCTGLEYDPSFDGFWSGDASGNTVYKLANNLSVLSTFTIPGPQEIAVVGDGTLWVNGYPHSYISHVYQNGTVIGTIPVTSTTTGISYDSNTDTIVTGGTENHTIVKYYSNGTIHSTITIPSTINWLDGMYFDPSDNTIWITEDPRYIHHLSNTGDVLQSYSFSNTGCIEGITKDANNDMWIQCDDYYHRSITNGNRIYNMGVNCNDIYVTSTQFNESDYKTYPSYKNLITAYPLLGDNSSINTYSSATLSNVTYCMDRNHVPNSAISMDSENDVFRLPMISGVKSIVIPCNLSKNQPPYLSWIFDPRTGAGTTRYVSRSVGASPYVVNYLTWMVDGLRNGYTNATLTPTVPSIVYIQNASAMTDDFNIFSRYTGKNVTRGTVDGAYVYKSYLTPTEQKVFRIGGQGTGISFDNRVYTMLNSNTSVLYPTTPISKIYINSTTNSSIPFNIRIYFTEDITKTTETKGAVYQNVSIIHTKQNATASVGTIPIELDPLYSGTPVLSSNNTNATVSRNDTHAIISTGLVKQGQSFSYAVSVPDNHDHIIFLNKLMKWMGSGWDYVGVAPEDWTDAITDIKVIVS